MDASKVHGLRVFLLTLLEIQTKGNNISCDEVESSISKGIASMLVEKFGSKFDQNGFSGDAIKNVDEYYLKYSGCIANNEVRKYACDKQNGLSLLIALALNDIY